MADFFVFSKILGFFAYPSNQLFVIGLAGFLLVRFARRAGIVLMALGIVGTGIIGLSPLGNLLILPLEERFEGKHADDRPVTGIVVLGGALDTLVADARGELALNESAERVTAIAELARRHPDARIVFSGGSGTLMFAGAKEADVASDLLASFGIDPARILQEDRARNTWENAVFSREIAQPQPGERWLLVTSAFHMPRAMGCFRMAGFTVEAHPVDFRTRGPEDAWRPFRAVGDGARRVDIAVREWIGLLAYYLTGKTDALFPAP